MEEVPPSPELVKRRKVRRKHGLSHSRLSLHHINNKSTHSVEAVADESNQPARKHDFSTRKKLSEFYFDNNSAEIETVQANPLASAILLEKANAILPPCRVPSPDFIAATGEEFLSVAELAKRDAKLNQPKRYNGQSIDKRHNYSFTQLDVDSQMINMFEAAELLAGSAKEDQPKVVDTGPDVLKLPVGIEATEKVPSNKQEDPKDERSLVQTILDDFSEDDGFCWEVDYSIVKTDSLRRTLRQLQDYIASPPKSVKRESVCRRYGNTKRQSKESIVRRLSYESDCSSQADHSLSDDESVASTERVVLERDGSDISMDGVAFNESILIQANLTQLSAFFSQAISSHTESEGQQREAEKDEMDSIDLEPPFYGLASEPPSPISLASNVEYSPRTVRFEFHPFTNFDDDSLQSVANEHQFTVPPKSPQIEHLLEDDEDLFMMAHPVEASDVSGRDRKFNQQTDGTTSLRGLPGAEKPIPVPGSEYRKSNVFSNAAPKTISDKEPLVKSEACDEQTKTLPVGNNRLDVNNETPVTEICRSPEVERVPKANVQSMVEKIGAYTNFPPIPVGCQLAQSTVSFSTAGGTGITVSKAALARARLMFAEEELTNNDDNLVPGRAVAMQPELGNMVHHPRNVKSDACSTAIESALTTSKEEVHSFSDGKHLCMDTENVPGGIRMGGFSTAGGSKITVSKQALERARTMFDEAEAENAHAGGTSANVSNVPLTGGGGFSTAAGNAIAVSKRALSRAQQMFTEEEPKGDKENVSENMLPAGGVGTGFSTAGGSKIAVSKKALERARMMFLEEEVGKAIEQSAPIVPEDGQPPAGGFSTATRSSISVSKAALVKARTLFVEEEQINAREVAQPSSGRPGANVVKSSFGSGFSSAAGKSLPVSEEALARAQLMFAQVEKELAEESDTVSRVTPAEGFRKRKVSSSQEDPMTPTKRPRMNRPQPPGGFQTSTPASLLPQADASKSSANVTSTRRAKSGSGEVEQFFADLDDEEFEELFRHQPSPAAADGGTKKQTRLLLSMFDQCAEGEGSKLEGESTVNSSITHWDDSFIDLLPKLPADEQGTLVPVDVQRKRKMEHQKQREFIASKPDELRRPRVSSFCRQKARPGRVGVEEFVGGSKPMPGEKVVDTNAASHRTLDDVMGFRFRMSDYYGETVADSNTTGIIIGSDREATLLMDHQHSSVGVEEMGQCLLASPGIDPRLVPPGWVENAWRWIVGKLSVLERNFNGHFRGALTPENVFLQLQYRYHVEIDSARRPPLRKVLERDDIASRRMVLFVSNVLPAASTLVGLELELSDGWYAVRTIIDAPLAAAVRRGKITIGTKLMVQGAELLNHKDGCSPLEVPPEVRLKIHANSTRRVRWPVKLGYYRSPVPFLTPCNGIHERGGLIGRFRAYVVRVYPLVYVEKLMNESHGSVLRSERMQQRHNRRNDATQLDSLHKLYNEIQQEIEQERATANLNRNIRITESTPCSQLQELLEGGLDVSFLDIELTPSQQTVIQRFQQQRQEELHIEINRRVKAQMDKRSSGRSSVTSLLKVRLMDHARPDRAFVLSIWRPTENVRGVMQEQRFLELHTISANGCKNSDVQLTAHKSSTYIELPVPESIGGEVARFRRTVTFIGGIDPLSFRPPFNEFDTIGVVVHVGPADSRKFQSIYLADTAMELLCVNFWHGLAEYAYDDVIHERAILCVANLQWRTIGRQHQAIAQSFATEYTTFTENPRTVQQRTEWDRFQLQLDAIDRDEFFQRCQERVCELHDITNGGGSVPGQPGTPVTPLQQQHRSMSSRMLLVPPAESSTPLRSGSTGGGSSAKHKMETLASIYGSPPKLSPIVIRSNPILRKGFKTPARLEDSNHIGASSGKASLD